jgi:hypothetical protein
VLTAWWFLRPREIEVPRDFPSVRAAVAAARSGDTVLIRPGHYRESTIALKNRLHLRGTDANQCRITLTPGAKVLFKADGIRDAKIEQLAIDGAQTVSLQATPESFKNGTTGLEANGSSIAIENCFISGFSRTGIVLSTKSDASITKCRFRGNHDAVSALGGSVRVTECEFMLNMTACDLRDGASGLVSDNTFDGNDTGIALTRAASGAVVQWNRVLRNVKRGIAVIDSGTAAIVGNVAESNGLWGIDVAGESSAVQVKQNAVRSNLQGIAWAKGARGAIEANAVESNAKSGVMIFDRGTAPTISANRVLKNGQYGVWVGSGAKPAIADNNAVTGNRAGGIHSE